MRYQVLMTEEELRFFSRHTPKNLERYRYINLSDKDIKRLSEGEIDDLIDDDSERASRNTSRYITKKLPKYMLSGAGAGAALGGAIGGVQGAAMGGIAGGFAGGIGAAVRGESKAQEEGHGRSHISRSVARRIDKVRGGNSYARMKEREDRRTQQQLDRERNLLLMQMAMK